MTDEPAPKRSAEPELPRPKHLPLLTEARRTVPALVPARMVNEVLYCERLAYLEWAQGEFADNVFTVDGRYVHERADSAGGKLPPRPAEVISDDDEDADEQGDEVAGEGDEPFEARSVWLSSERIGVTAKIDIVEGDASGRVLPVEYKRGRAPNVMYSAYLPERAQICVQVLLLREHGYACDEGAIYFARSRKRVRVVVDENLLWHTERAIARLRAVVQGPIPPPLDDSPKCRGCSLSGICLPDEVNLLRRLRGEPEPEPEPDETELGPPLDPDPWGLTVGIDAGAGSTKPGLRRLQPGRDDRVPLYVQDYRSRVRLAGEQIIVEGSPPVRARLMNTSQVVLFGNAQITSQAIRALVERGITITFMTGGGYYVGRALGNDTNNVDLRRAQHRRADDPETCLQLARAFVRAKIKSCRVLLRRNHTEIAEHAGQVTLKHLRHLARKAEQAESPESLLGIEGAAAHAYFQSFSGMLKANADLGTFHFESRNRRPPRDPVNALLSFLYSLLTKDLVWTVSAVGLEPLVGFYHQPRFGRPALALDLMEEFRPLVADSVAVQVINTRVVSASDFVQVGEACSLTPAGRRNIIAAYERRMDQEIVHPVFGYRISYRRVLEVQARLLSRYLMGELDRYPSFSTR